MELPIDTHPLILCGHVIEELKKLPAESVHVVVTSPPYWGLRNYSMCPCSIQFVQSDSARFWDGRDHGSNGGQIAPEDKRAHKVPEMDCPWCRGTGTIEMTETVWGGRADCQHTFDIKCPPRRERNLDDVINPESIQATHLGATIELTPTYFCSSCGAWRGSLGEEYDPDLFVEHLVMVFREVRRVLRKDGILWVNIGDSYIGGKGQGTGNPERETLQDGRHQIAGRGDTRPQDRPQYNLKPKDMALVPQRFALAMQKDGWWVRNEIIWYKRAAMPFSGRDRCTTSHEQIWLFSRSKNYFYDNQAVRNPPSPESNAREKYIGKGIKNYAAVGVQDASDVKRRILENMEEGVGGNLRDVWTISTANSRVAHFATFHENLPRQCILLGTSEYGACADCGVPWERVLRARHTKKHETDANTNPEGDATERISLLHHDIQEDSIEFDTVERNDLPEEDSCEFDTVGWQRTCRCTTDRVVPCIVLDPFGGSGTTSVAAKKLHRRSIMIELNPYNIPIVQKRLTEANIQTVSGVQKNFLMYEAKDVGDIDP